MPYPLVLKQGRVSEELPTEVGENPYLRYSGGGLMAGGAGLFLYLVDGAITQLPSFEGVFWDALAQWDSGAASWGADWDFYGGAVWDGDAATWS